VKHRIYSQAALAVIVAAVTVSCGGSKSNPTPTTPTPPAAATLTSPKLDSPAASGQTDTLRPTLTVQNATSDQPSGTRTYEFQVSDTTSFSATTTSSTIRGFDAQVGKTGVPEGAGGKTSFTVESDLQPTTMFFWRARAVQGSAIGPWSDTFQFRSKLVGFIRAGELYDPLIHGVTVGEVVGSVTFLQGEGARLNNGGSYIKYLLPQTITAGEFSMDVKGLRPNGPGDKTKIMGMQEGQGDYIVNDYRVDIQYRGSTGFPPNAITFRAIYGDADDLDVRYEPDTAVRFASVFPLNPATVYHWKATWGPEFRVQVRDGGTAGNMFYNVGVKSSNAVYRPTPHYAYAGAPTGRSGAESASIEGAIYRNVWLSTQPRPATLGSALQ
jgi:hypothetical protein